MLAANIYNLPSHFLGVMLFKRKPYDLPYSRSLFLFLFLSCSFITSYFALKHLTTILHLANLNVNFEIDFPSVFLTSFLERAISLTIVYSLLKFKGFDSRFIQTGSNIVGVSICTILITVFVLQLNLLDDTARLLLNLITFWGVCVNITILKKSFDTNIFGAIQLYLISIVGLIAVNFGLTYIFSAIR